VQLSLQSAHVLLCSQPWVPTRKRPILVPQVQPTAQLPTTPHSSTKEPTIPKVWLILIPQATAPARLLPTMSVPALVPTPISQR
jgi:hypothetical protein